MPIIVALLALVVPRAVILLLWLLTDWFAGVFDTLLWPILGFLLLPTSLLWYSAVQNWFGGVWGIWQILGMVVAVLIDLSPGRKGARSRA